jgi:hypothetical protein
MKFTYRVTIEMTAGQRDQYAAEYGIDHAEVRDDIRRYIENNEQCSPGLNVEEGRTSGVTVR